MPRTARASIGNICYHVINRGNGGAKVFRKKTDYIRFTEMMCQACKRLPLRVVCWCLMPNHFHLVLWPYEDGDLSKWMQWLMTCHVRRYHRHYDSNGHVWQGRFKAFPIQEDSHYLTVLRYIESNPLRAALTTRAEQWEWSSLHTLFNPGVHPLLYKGPLERTGNWLNIVNQQQTEIELDTIRKCVNRNAPFGDIHWTQKTAESLGLQSTINPRGRPPMKIK